MGCLFAVNLDDDGPFFIGRKFVGWIPNSQQLIVDKILLIIFFLVKKLCRHVMQRQFFIAVNEISDDPGIGSIAVIDQRRVGSLIERVDILQNIVIGQF